MRKRFGQDGTFLDGSMPNIEVGILKVLLCGSMPNDGVKFFIINFDAK